MLTGRLGHSRTTGAINLSTLHEALVAHRLVNLGIIIIVVRILHPTYRAGESACIGIVIQSVQTEIKRCAHGCKVVLVGTPIHLTHASPRSTYGVGNTELVSSLLRYRRQTHHQFVTADHIELVTQIVVPSLATSQQIIEL